MTTMKNHDVILPNREDLTNEILNEFQKAYLRQFGWGDNLLKSTKDLHKVSKSAIAINLLD